MRDDIKGPGYFAFAPARLADGGTVVVNRGFVANPHPDAVASPDRLAEGARRIVGVLRWPEPPASFVTAHYRRARTCGSCAINSAMAARYGWGEVAPFYIELEAPSAGGRRAAAGPRSRSTCATTTSTTR